MESNIKQYQIEYMAKGETEAMALVLAQTRQLTNEFNKLHADIKFIKVAIQTKYAEKAIKRMNKDE